jgi:hypothetical protein
MGEGAEHFPPGGNKKGGKLTFYKTNNDKIQTHANTVIPITTVEEVYIFSVSSTLISPKLVTTQK